MTIRSIYFLIFGFILNLALGADPGACVPDIRTSSPGFRATFYPYENAYVDGAPNYNPEDAYFPDANINYLLTGYRNTPIQGATSGVTEPAFSYGYPTDPYLIQWEDLASDYVYGVFTSVSNFTLELTGYFLAPETGEFAIEVTADNGAVVTFGAGQAFECCNTQILSNDGEFTLFSNEEFNGSLPNILSEPQRLTAGFYYPIRISFVNTAGPAALDLVITTPSGIRITDFDETIFSFLDVGSNCPYVPPTVTFTTPWTGTTTRTITHTPSSDGDTITVEIDTPVPTTTFTTPWTGTTTRTITPVSYTHLDVYKRQNDW